jgi:hypothetical protein
LQRARFWQRGDLQARLDVVNLELADAKHAYGRVQQAVLA